MNKKIIRNYGLMFISALIIGFGASFITYGNLGGDAMTTFEQGLSRTFPIELAVAQLIANLLFAAILFVIDRKRVNIDTLLCPLCISLGCKIISNFITYTDVMITQYIYLFVGMLICAFGIGIGAQTPSGSNPYDGTVLALSDKTGKKYSILRPVCDVILLIIAILLKGTFNVGTIIVTILMGPIANIFIDKMSFLKGEKE